MDTLTSEMIARGGLLGVIVVALVIWIVIKDRQLTKEREGRDAEREKHAERIVALEQAAAARLAAEAAARISDAEKSTAVMIKMQERMHEGLAYASKIVDNITDYARDHEPPSRRRP